MRLPNGTCGFFEAGKCSDPFDIRKFKQVCYCVVNENRGNLLSVDTALNGKNFYTAKIEVSNSLVYLLMNAYYPYIAFASLVEYGKIIFRDKPTNLSFSFPQYHVLNAEELNTSCRSALEELSDIEIAQIKYWKPATIGEIVFNFWD